MTDFYSAFRPTPPPPAEPPPATIHTLDTRRATTYADTALRNEINAVLTAAEGTRNHTLNRAAYNLGGLITAGHLNHTDVHDALRNAALTAGLNPTEIEATLRSGLGAGGQNPRTIPEPTAVPTATVLGTPVEEFDAAAGIVTVDLAAKVRDRLPIVDWHALWADDTVDDYILEPLIPARRLVALYSAPKVGKSLLMLELAVGIAAGRRVLGTVPDRAHRVLYVDFENDPRGDIRERLQAMGATPDQLDNLCYLSFPTIAMLDTEAGSLELLAAAQVYNCDLVVIDTVSRAVGGDENENDTWLNFYRHTGLKMKQAQIACVRLDHTGKDESKGMRGGSAKYGDVDAVWSMSRVTDTTYRLECTANRLPIAEKVIVVHRETEPLRHRVDAVGNRAAWDAKVTAAVTAMDAIGLPDGAGREIAKAALIEHNGKVGFSTDVVGAAVAQRKQRYGATVVTLDDDTDDDPVEQQDSADPTVRDEVPDVRARAREMARKADLERSGQVIPQHLTSQPQVRSGQETDSDA